MVSKTDRDPAELLLHENLRLMAGLFQVEPTLRFTPVEIGFKRKEAATSSGEAAYLHLEHVVLTPCEDTTPPRVLQRRFGTAASRLGSK